MKKEFLINDLSELLEVNATLINDDYLLDPDHGWDSLAIVSVIGAIDQYYSVRVSGDDLISCHCVNDIFVLISSRIQDAA